MPRSDTLSPMHPRSSIISRYIRRAPSGQFAAMFKFLWTGTGAVERVVVELMHLGAQRSAPRAASAPPLIERIKFGLRYLNLARAEVKNFGALLERRSYGATI